MKYPPEKFNFFIAPEKLPKPNRKGWSSNHHFSGAMLNLHRLILLKCWDFQVENDAIVTIRIVVHFEEGIPIIKPLFATQASWVGGDFSGLKWLQFKCWTQGKPLGFSPNPCRWCKSGIQLWMPVDKRGWGGDKRWFNVIGILDCFT